MRHALVFCAAALLDVVWSLNVRGVAERRPVLASVASAFTILLAGFTTLSFVSDPRYLVAAALGGFAGTFLVVRWR